MNVDPDASLQEVARTMIEHRAHQVFVVEHGIVEGVITAFDLLRRFVDPDEPLVHPTGYRR